MRDSHPAKKLDRTCDCRGYDAPRTGLTVPRTFDCKSGRCAQGMLGDDRAEALPSPMVQPIGLPDYSTALGLPHPEAELAMLNEELVTIALYPDRLGTLRRVREQQCEDSRHVQSSPMQPR